MSKQTLLILLFMSFTLFGKPKKEVKNDDPDEELEDGESIDIFCKTKDNLIKLERNIYFFPVDTYVNNSISMQCKYCEEKDDGLPKNWSRQERLFTGNITEVEFSGDDNHASSKVYVTKIHSLVIRNIQEKHMGLYFCKAPFIDKLEKSFNYLVEIMNHTVDDLTGDLNAWKNYSEKYLIPLNHAFANERNAAINNRRINITVFTDWAEWSACDACLSVAKQFRVGKCRVKPTCDDPSVCFNKTLINDTFFDDKHNTEKPKESYNPEAAIKSIVQFSIELSCKSLLLKNVLPSVYKRTSAIPDFILQAKCKGVCKGRTLTKGARYKRSIILTQGAHLTLVCPDSTIDSEIRWEHNKVRLYPNEGSDYINGSVEPRIYVDSFSTLYLFEVTEEESGNYTCYVDEVRIQEVRIFVLKRSVFFTKEFKRHLNYLAIVFSICFVAYVSGTILVCIRQRREEQSTARQTDETQSLLDTYDSSN